MNNIDYDFEFQSLLTTTLSYRDVVRRMLSRLLSVQENGKFLTLTSIASRIDVSLVTLSRCYNEVQDMSGSNFMRLLVLYIHIFKTFDIHYFQNS